MNSNDAKILAQVQLTRAKTLVREKWADPKIRRFAIWGAAGCLIGAIVGELLLSVVRYTSSGPPRAVCLLIDCSGSMMPDFIDLTLSGPSAGKIGEVKSAASEFVGRQNLTNGKIAVVGFESSAHRVAPAISDIGRLRSAIGTLEAHGSTAMHLGLDAAREELPADHDTMRSILLFTDGMPDDREAALQAAKNCREQLITIVVIATGDAISNTPDSEEKKAFLAQITGDPALVFPVGSGEFGEGFHQAEKALSRGSLVESESGSGSWWKSLLVISAWTALLACGMSLALIVGQNLYLKRDALTSHEALTGSLGGIAAGVVGGVAGQIAFLSLGFSATDTVLGYIAAALGRLIGWTILGALVGRGLAVFIPNLDPRRTLQGGAVGGAVGASAFLFASLLGDTLGRFLGAAILGACIGMMIALIEAVERRFWLELRFGTKETICVNLGPTPVKIGSDSRACSVYARGARPLAVAYKLENDRVSCTDYETEKTTVAEPGSERVVGNLTAIVRSAYYDGAQVGRDTAATGGSPPPVSAAPRTTPLPPPPSLMPRAANAKPNEPAKPAVAPTAASPLPLQASPKPMAPPPSKRTDHPIGEVRTIRPVPPPPPSPKAKE